MLGVIPFGLVVGFSASEAGYTPAEVALQSAMMFTGTAQITFLHLRALDSPILIAVISTVIVNVRLLLYSFSMASHWQDIPRKWRLVMGFLLTDQAFAVSLKEYKQNTPTTTEKVWLYIGFAVVFYVFWILSTVLGHLLGAFIPSSWEIGFGLAFDFFNTAGVYFENPVAIFFRLCCGRTRFGTL